MESKNVSRKQWTAVQAKVLKQRYADDAKFDEVVKQRKDAGLYYLDDMFPNDDMDWRLDEICLDKNCVSQKFECHHRIQNKLKIWTFKPVSCFFGEHLL